MGIRRKTVNDVNKENIDTSVNIDKKVVFQNDETSAPVIPKFSQIRKNKITSERKKLSGYRMIDIKIFVKCV